MTKKDTRVTMKLEKALWIKMERLIEAHPEWGVLSVPEYVRRAIDSDLRSRTDGHASKSGSSARKRSKTR